MSIAVGTQIDDYEILGRLGVGGMGEVYLARDRRLDRKVAIKFLADSLAQDDQAKDRLEREAKAAAKLEHKNICSTYAFGNADGRSYIVFQYISGHDLAAKLRDGALGIPEALSIATQIAEALAAAHSHNIIHRDIKPANVMIGRDGEVKVLDFGLAKVLLEQKSVHPDSDTQNMLSSPGAIMGTVAYMSPEQTRGERLDQRSDIFSFGVLLYEVITGKRPFEAPSTAGIIAAILTTDPPIDRDRPHGVSSGLAAAILKCLEKSREARYQSMAEVLIDLDEIQRAYSRDSVDSHDAKTLAAPTVLLVKPPSSSVRRSTVLVTAVAIMVVSSVGLGLYVFSIGTPSVSSPPQSARSAISTANDLYLRGKVKIGSENKENTDAGIGLLEQAVAADPNFAAGYAELARAYNVKAIYFAAGDERKTLSENAEFAVAKALSIDPDLPEGHFARGLLLWTHENHFPHELAIRSYKRAAELNPNFDEARHQLATVYFHIGLTEKAREELNSALTINPANRMARFRLGTVDSYEGKFEEALIKFKAVPREANRALIDRATADVLLRFGRIDEAEKIVGDYMKDLPSDEGGAMTSVQAVIFAKRGQTPEAEGAIVRANELGRGFGHFHHTTYNIVAAYAIMNKEEEALKWLKETADDGFPCYPLFNADPNLDNLRDHAGFIAFMSKLKQQLEVFRSTL